MTTVHTQYPEDALFTISLQESSAISSYNMFVQFHFTHFPYESYGFLFMFEFRMNVSQELMKPYFKVITKNRLIKIKRFETSADTVISTNFANIITSLKYVTHQYITSGSDR
jgi:hypothetical protein